MSVRIKLDDLTNEQKESIRKYMFMQPKKTGFYKKKRYTTAKDPILLWHVDKPNNEIVVPYTFGNSLMGYHINSRRTYPGGSYNFTVDLLPRQVPVAAETYQHLITTGTTTLGVYPGFGKTAVSAYLASKIGGLVLVVYPLTTVEDSWYNTFKEFTDASIWLNNGKNPLPSSCNVILTMSTQFHKIHPEILKMVRILVIDEAHMFCVPDRINSLLGTTPQYVIACTATLERTDGMHSIIHAICGTHGVFLKSPKRFQVHMLATGIKTEIHKNKQGDPDWSRLVKDLANDKLRNEMIVSLVEQNPQHKIMIMTWNKAHVNLLRDMIADKNIPVDTLFGNKNSYKDSRVLIATISKAGTGFDERMKCPDWGGVRSNMMILTGSTKSLAGLEQVTGRVFRAEFPTVIDLVDDNKICKRHWNERRKWYEDPERNGEIIYNEMIKEEDVTVDNNVESITNRMADKIKAKLANKSDKK